MVKVHEDCPAGTILTKGLGSDYDKWIIAAFQLFLGVGSPPIGEISVAVRAGVERINIPYRDPYDDEPWEYPETELEKEVIIKVRLGKREIERHYFRKNADRTIKAINILNTTKDKITVTADKIKNTTQKAAVILRNLKKKD